MPIFNGKEVSLEICLRYFSGRDKIESKLLTEYYIENPTVDFGILRQNLMRLSKCLPQVYLSNKWQLDLLSGNQQRIRSVTSSLFVSFKSDRNGLTPAHYLAVSGEADQLLELIDRSSRIYTLLISPYQDNHNQIFTYVFASQNPALIRSFCEKYPEFISFNPGIRPYYHCLIYNNIIDPEATECLDLYVKYFKLDESAVDCMLREGPFYSHSYIAFFDKKFPGLYLHKMNFGKSFIAESASLFPDGHILHYLLSQHPHILEDKNELNTILKTIINYDLANSTQRIVGFLTKYPAFSKLAYEVLSRYRKGFNSELAGAIKAKCIPLYESDVLTGANDWRTSLSNLRELHQAGIAGAAESYSRVRLHEAKRLQRLADNPGQVSSDDFKEFSELLLPISEASDKELRDLFKIYAEQFCGKLVKKALNGDKLAEQRLQLLFSDKSSPLYKDSAIPAYALANLYRAKNMMSDCVTYLKLAANTSYKAATELAVQLESTANTPAEIKEAITYYMAGYKNGDPAAISALERLSKHEDSSIACIANLTMGIYCASNQSSILFSKALALSADECERFLNEINFNELFEVDYANRLFNYMITHSNKFEQLYLEAHFGRIRKAKDFAKANHCIRYLQKYLDIKFHAAFALKLTDDYKVPQEVRIACLKHAIESGADEMREELIGRLSALSPNNLLQSSSTLSSISSSTHVKKKIF